MINSLDFALERDGIIARLKQFDEEARLLCTAATPELKIIIVGGSAFVLANYTERMTHDIDVLSVPARLTGILENYDMNTRVSAYLDSFPYNFEDRLESLDLGNTFLQYFTPSIEDLVISKLYAMREPDLDDITNEGVLKDLNWDLLEHLVYDKDEASASVLSVRRYREMTRNYENYKREYYDESTVL